MSSFQNFIDAGVAHGLLGRFNSPNHTGNPTDGFLRKNIELIKGFCMGAGVVVLSETHEPVRMATLRHDMKLIPGCENARVLTQAASGVIVTRDEMLDLKIATICLPVCDHAVAGIQLIDRHKRVIGMAMIRVTPDRLQGDESELVAFFDRLRLFPSSYVHQVVDVHFHLSAGRGPCCVPRARVELVQDERDAEEIDADKPDDHEEARGVDMLAEIADEAGRLISRWNRPILSRGAKTAGLSYCVHQRDTACTVCCGGADASPYYTNSDGKNNLAFFHSALEIPEFPRW